MSDPSPDLPARRLSTEELERVIRRAVELQAERETAGDAELTEEDALRIGAEIGIEASHLRQALLEADDPPAERGAMARYFGAGTVSAARILPRPAAEVRAILDRYMIDRETLSVHRRFRDTVVYARREGVFADMTRMVRRGVGRFPLAKAGTVSVTVRELDEESCQARLVADLRKTRSGAATGGLVGGGMGGGSVGLAAAITLAPPAALIGVPLLLFGTEAARRSYRRYAERAEEKLAGLLDRVEHGLPLVPEGGRWFDL